MAHTTTTSDQIQHLLECGYTAMSRDSDGIPCPKFSFMQEGAPVKIGKLRKVDPDSLTAWKPQLYWNSPYQLYGLGIVTPCLHLGKEYGPHWTLCATVVFSTSPSAQQKLERVRVRLGKMQRSLTWEIPGDQKPFSPDGVTFEYHSENALQMTSAVGLPDEYKEEAREWAARLPLASRLYTHNLDVIQVFGATTSTDGNHLSSPPALISKHL